MRKSLKILSLLALFAATGSAKAEWTMVSTSNSGAAYADLNSIRRAGGTVKMFTMRDLITPREVGNKSYRSIVALEEYDCADRRNRTLQSSAYAEQMRNGENIYTAQDTPWQWSYPEPGTIAETFMNIACKASK